MAIERHLPKAPIREATLDIMFPRAGHVSLDALRARLDDLGEFDQIHEIKSHLATFEFSVEEAPEGHVEVGEPSGFRAATADGLWVVQFRLDRLTVSRLAPYQDWCELSEQGRRYAEALIELTGPERIDRVALRYINHFRIPHPASLDDYFLGLPRPPKGLPQFLSSMLSRMTIHDPTRDFSAQITQSLVDDLDPEKMGFILDIDAFQTTDFPVEVGPLWETFDALRVFKNQLFFGLITELNAEMHE